MQFKREEESDELQGLVAQETAKVKHLVGYSHPLTVNMFKSWYMYLYMYHHLKRSGLVLNFLYMSLHY